MSVFKLFFQIVKKNKLTFLLAIIINLGVTMVYASSLNNNSDTSFDANKSKIAIVNHDQGEVSQALVNYLTKQSDVVKIGETNKEQEDALFFKEVLYIATIPQDFSEQVQAGSLPKLETKSVPNSPAELYTNSLINQYLSKYQFYQKYYPEKSPKQLTELVEKNLAVQPAIHFATSKSDADQRANTARIFNMLSFGLFTTVLASITLVSVSINKKEIRLRNSSSPITLGRQSLSFALAAGIFSLVAWILYTGYTVYVTKSTLFTLATNLYILNSFVFLGTLISLSVMIAALVKSEQAVNGLTNILVLGTCFISGAFVPQVLLDDVVLKIASFFPTYWFVSNNELLASLQHVTTGNLGDYFFNLGIQVLFIIVFTLAGLFLRKERGGLKAVAF